MPVNAPTRFTARRLSVNNFEVPSYTVSQWRGNPGPSARDTAAEAVGDLLGRVGERLVLQVEGLSEPADGVLVLLARGIQEAQRMGRRVTLVRCSDDLFRQLQRQGVTGVTHAACLLSATQGLAADREGSVDLYLRSEPGLLPRLRNVVAAVARKAHLDDETELHVKSAVTEAATNAILHGSPEGQRNHVRVSFVVDGPLLIVEVADQGGGFDPTGIRVPTPADLAEHGYGLHIMRRSMDRVEFFRDDRGMLVRMTKYLATA
jgi:anti-sigma regulatory factor (Ser/Thr protein kinase)